MRLDATTVLGAAAAWVYVPEGAPVVRTDEFHVVAFPAHFFVTAGAFTIASGRPAAAVVDDVAAAARGLDRHEVVVWLHDTTRPAGITEELLARGAELQEQLAVLARPLDTLPQLDHPTDIEIRPTTDLATQRDHERVGVEVFGGSMCSEDELAAAVARRSPSSGEGFVAYRNGRPVATGGTSIADGVLRLWGGAVLPEARRTGAYRAVLAYRLEHGRAAGCGFALVKGRVDTSAPILRRAGFEKYGEERGYLLGLT